MAQYVLQFAVVIPAQTLPSAPVTIPITMDNWDIEQIDLDVPPGPAGLMGFYISNNGVQWIPATVGQFIVWDNHRDSWPMTDQPNASGWAITGYNTGTYNHSVTVRFHVNNPQQSLPTPTAPAVTFVSTGVPVADPVTL